jgi:hypothetical protein
MLMDGAVSYSCTLELTEGTTIVTTTGLSCTANLTPIVTTQNIPVMVQVAEQTITNPDNTTTIIPAHEVQATDAGGVPIFNTVVLSTEYDRWVTHIKAEIKRQADEYIAQYKVLMQLVNIPFPTAVVPQDAINALALAIEPTIVV